MIHSTNQRIPLRYLEPAFFGGLLDDPLLYVRIRPLKRALLFDCGQITHLSKKVIKPIDTVFISHAHMDHCMGIPTLVRHQHASSKPLDIFGPPGIATRVHHQLQGYDWNLCEPYWFTVRVHEVHEKQIVNYSFRGPERFMPTFDGKTERNNQEIWSCRYVNVGAVLLDHKLPALAFRIQEKAPFNVDLRLMKSLELMPGDWIRDLKKLVIKGDRSSGIELLRRDGEVLRKVITKDPDSFYRLIQGKARCSSIGYLSDTGWTDPNLNKIGVFFKDITLLCAECTFLAEDLEKARASYHLCTEDLNKLTTLLKPCWLLPMHLSKSYLHRTADLYGELKPPKETFLLKLPKHLAPAPLKISDVEKWLRPGPQHRSPYSDTP